MDAPVTGSPLRVGNLVAALRNVVTRPWAIMEVCGGQTHAILRHGLEELLPPGVSLIHGPGCPVCVTPAADIDAAIALALTPNTLVCCFGDMLRVPGSTWSLLQARAHGARVQVVYSPLDALEVARREPTLQVVLFAVGFETTVPSTALTLVAARATEVHNFYVLCSHVQVPPALHLLLSDPECAVDGLLAAGHVCAVMGLEQYRPLSERYHIPIVATGFEAEDILLGLLECLSCLEQGRAEVRNAYAHVVDDAGTPRARSVIDQVFCSATHEWRGFGEIDEGGYALREHYRRFDARTLLSTSSAPKVAPSEHQKSSAALCISNLILKGRKRPDECPAFGIRCTPESPLGAPMVSSEGACAAYARYRRQIAPQ